MAMVVLSSREMVWGGGEVFLHALGIELVRRGHVARWRVPTGSELARRLDPTEIVARRRPVRADFVIANDFRSVWESLILDRGLSRKFVVHGDWQLSPLRARIVEHFGVAPFGVSAQVKESAIRDGIRGGMDILPLGPPPSREPLPSAAPPMDNFVLGGVARWDKVKRIQLFCQTIRALEVRGVLLAPRPTGADEREMNDLVNLYPEIQVIHGSADDLWPLCDAFLSTSVSESLGLAHLEALSAGKLVLSTAAHGPRDFMTGPLAIGRMTSSEPIGLAREIRGAVVRAVEHWPSYLEHAARELAGRGPRRCAETILGESW